MDERRVYATADIIRADCDGHEADVCARGYVDMTWSPGTIDTKVRDEAACDACPEGPDVLPPAVWLANYVRDAIGLPDNIQGGGTWYGQPFVMANGDDVTIALHAHGFTDDEISRANEILSARD